MTKLLLLLISLVFAQSSFAENYKLIPQSFAAEIEAIKFGSVAVPGTLNIDHGFEIEGDISVRDLDSLSNLSGEIYIKNPYFDTGVVERDETIKEAIGDEIRIEILGGQYDKEARLLIADVFLTINNTRNKTQLKVRIIPGDLRGQSAVGVKGVVIIERSKFNINLGFLGSVGDDKIREEVVLVFGAVFK